MCNTGGEEYAFGGVYISCGHTQAGCSKYNTAWESGRAYGQWYWGGGPCKEWSRAYAKRELRTLTPLCIGCWKWHTRGCMKGGGLRQGTKADPT